MHARVGASQGLGCAGGPLPVGQGQSGSSCVRRSGRLFPSQQVPLGPLPFSQGQRHTFGQGIPYAAPPPKMAMNLLTLLEGTLFPLWRDEQSSQSPFATLFTE